MRQIYDILIALGAGEDSQVHWAVLSGSEAIDETKWESFALDSDREQIVAFALNAARDAFDRGRQIGRAQMAEDMRNSLEGMQ